MLDVASPPSTTPELDLKTFFILRDFCQKQMTLPNAELLVEGVFIDASELYDDSRWRPWLTKINDSEDDSFDAVDIAERVEEEIKTLKAHLSGLTVTSPPSPTPTLSSPSSPTPSAFRTEPMDIDFDLAADLSRGAAVPTSESDSTDGLAAFAASSDFDLAADLSRVAAVATSASDSTDVSQNLAPSTASSSSNTPQVKLSLKEYLARKKQREADMVVEQEFPASGKFSLFCCSMIQEHNTYLSPL